MAIAADTIRIIAHAGLPIESDITENSLGHEGAPLRQALGGQARNS
jgi:hypothetical protein